MLLLMRNLKLALQSASQHLLLLHLIDIKSDLILNLRNFPLHLLLLLQILTLVTLIKLLSFSEFLEQLINILILDLDSLPQIILLIVINRLTDPLRVKMCHLNIYMPNSYKISCQKRAFFQIFLNQLRTVDQQGLQIQSVCF